MVNDDYHVLKGFTRPPNSLTEEGRWLVRHAKSISEYYIHTQMDEGNICAKDITTPSVDSPLIVPANFVEI